MGATGEPKARPDYGIDAPPVIRNLLLVGGAAAATAAALFALGVAHPWGVGVGETAAVLAAVCLINAGAMVWYSKVGKLRGRERLLDLVRWRGDEAVLDIGCGRGLLLIGAARRLTTGKAVGVDLWQGADLSGNRPEATRDNARREGVADRVEVKDGDARSLPFGDASFDVVVSNVALHNIPEREGRRQAVREIARVLKPGGRVVLSDIKHTADYAQVLSECGLEDVKRTATRLTWLVAAFTFGGVRPHRVAARKPAARDGAGGHSPGGVRA
jgi:SAM-dependent methyltransferase